MTLITWSFVTIGGSVAEKTKSIRGKIIRMLLLMQNVEANPSNKVGKSNLAVRTYNCNRLGNIHKFGKILTKVREEYKQGGIVVLQEMHIIGVNIIKMYWKINFRKLSRISS